MGIKKVTIGDLALSFVLGALSLEMYRLIDPDYKIYFSDPTDLRWWPYCLLFCVLILLIDFAIRFPLESMYYKTNEEARYIYKKIIESGVINKTNNSEVYKAEIKRRIVIGLMSVDLMLFPLAMDGVVKSIAIGELFDMIIIRMAASICFIIAFILLIKVCIKISNDNIKRLHNSGSKKIQTALREGNVIDDPNGRRKISLINDFFSVLSFACSMFYILIDLWCANQELEKEEICAEFIVFTICVFVYWSINKFLTNKIDKGNKTIEGKFNILSQFSSIMGFVLIGLAIMVKSVKYQNVKDALQTNISIIIIVIAIVAAFIYVLIKYSDETTSEVSEMMYTDTSLDTLSRYWFVPLALVVAVVPLVCMIHQYDPGLSEYSWFSSNNTYIDTFLYYKSFVFQILGAATLVVMACLLTIHDGKYVREIRENMGRKKQRHQTPAYPLSRAYLHDGRTLPPAIAMGIFAIVTLTSSFFSEHTAMAFFGGHEQYEGCFVLLSYVICFFFAFGYTRTLKLLRFMLDALLKDYILFGAGPDNFIVVFPNDDYVGAKYWGVANQTVSRPHNTYLQIWVQEGLLAMLAMVFVYGLYMVRVVRLCYRRRKVEEIAAIDGAGETVGKSGITVGPGGGVRYLLRKGIDFESVAIVTAIAATGYMVAGLANDSFIGVAPVFWVMMGVGYAAEAVAHRQ